MPGAPTLTVACLCAAWCGVCRDYRAAFDAAATTRGRIARFVWIDIEDETDRLGEVEVETFPTIVIVSGTAALFAGPVTPSSAVLERLVDEAASGRLARLAEPGHGVEALAARIGADFMPSSG